MTCYLVSLDKMKLVFMALVGLVSCATVQPTVGPIRNCSEVTPDNAKCVDSEMQLYQGWSWKYRMTQQRMGRKWP